MRTTTTRDAEILEILKELAEAHRAWHAHREGADAIALTHFGGRSQDLIEQLKQAWLDAYGRLLRRTGGFRR